MFSLHFQLIVMCLFGILCLPSSVQASRSTVSPNKALSAAIIQQQQETHYAQAKQAYLAKQPVEPIAKTLYTLAKAGYTPAQFTLGQFLRLGIGGVSQPEYARFWYLAAAKQQHPLACWQLATSYWQGMGGIQDTVQAIAWFEETAKKPSYYKAKALWNATALHWQSDTHELRRMEQHWKLLALQGDAEAKSNLGVLYLGNPSKTKESINYLRQASVAGNLVAKAYLGYWLAQQPNSKPNTHTEALLLLTHTAQRNVGFGQYFLGQYYYQKRFDPTYAQLAFKWLTITKHQHPALAGKVNPLLMELQVNITPKQRTTLTANAYKSSPVTIGSIPILVNPQPNNPSTMLPTKFYTVEGYQLKTYTALQPDVFL
jgi:TPR repeat protein